MQPDFSYDDDTPLAERFSHLKVSNGSLPDPFVFLQNHPNATLEEIVAVCSVDQSWHWQSGQRNPVEEYVNKIPQLRDGTTHLLPLIMAEYRYLTDSGLLSAMEDFLGRFPTLRDQIQECLQDSWRPGSTVLLPSANTETVSRESLDGECPGTDQAVPKQVSPASFGKFRIQRILGDGGFGRVYLAFDEELRRSVAIKVPHEYRISSQDDVDAYFEEARILASLDHPGIVPVFDFGRTEDGRCYCVTKYVEGSDLATRNRQSPLTSAAAAELVAVVAEALHYSHLRGVIHRDIKLANILVDPENRPYITDFGIALKDADWGKDSPSAGTPAYMSPEQIRGEGHLVDGRSDIFSLGIVLYELLSGRRPFGRVWKDRMAATEARPLRQIDDSIPPDLERICQRAMAHRVSERYNTARDMADDLRHALDRSQDSVAAGPRMPQLSSDGYRATSDLASSYTMLTIVPKGLRSFDRDDAGFFCELLPGPRDRDGLPESIRFWKTRILSRDVDDSFRVGLIYGPSGCGKSSFLKAGVLPQLPDTVLPVYVEATAVDTEQRLLKGLRKVCPSLAQGILLPEAMAALRREHLLRGDSKVLVVIDQFEQWLHVRQRQPSDELLRALRQCDGVHVQCIIGIRDDFWMPVTHFMEDLEVLPMPDRNLASLDLFSPRHARKVLIATGRAYGALPAGEGEIDRRAQQFVRKAVDQLADNGLVVPVHLALFAEMVKDKVWAPATLQELGGIAGVGVTFLEETFNGRTANPHHRLHQKAARAVLESLLPDDSRNIKGYMRSYQELLECSGYEHRKTDFDALLRILDSELRLITPTDPVGMSLDDADVSHIRGEDRHYHLTHDYLVPSLTEWLALRKAATRRGRAELLLSRRAAVWQAHPSSRTLPSFLEWLRILLFTSRRNRAHLLSEQRMMKSAGRYFGSRVAVVGLCAASIAWWASNAIPRSEAGSLVLALETADTQDVPAIVRQLEELRAWADPLLVNKVSQTEPNTRAALHLKLAILPVDQSVRDELIARMLNESPQTLQVIGQSLVRHTDNATLADDLLSAASGTEQPPLRRLKAAAALAGIETLATDADRRWNQLTGFAAQQLIVQIADNQSQFPGWIDAFRPVRRSLVPTITNIYSSRDNSELHQNVAAGVLSEYVADEPTTLCDLLLEATVQQHRTLLPVLQEHAREAEQYLRPIADTDPAIGLKYAARSAFVRRQAHAAALLFALNRYQPVWRFMSQTDDPEVTAFLELRLSSLALQLNVLADRLQASTSVPLNQAIIRTLGGVDKSVIDSMSRSLREQCLSQFETAFRTNPDSGIHSAAEWALGRWSKQIQLEAETENGHDWFVIRQGQTMIRFDGPVICKMGSPVGEPGRGKKDEELHSIRIDRSFAISSKEVTQEQYIKYQKDYRFRGNPRGPELQCPAIAVNWIDAAQYCRWLCKQENLPPDEWPYPQDVVIDFGMELPENFLERTGYRLPTEAEWEFACRCGTTSAYGFGSDTEVLQNYAWYQDNSMLRTWPVGSLKPNLRGLFDMHGNVHESCHNIYSYDTHQVDIGETRPLRTKGDRVFETVSRGGSYAAMAEEVRTANRRGDSPTALNYSLGFRLARTISPLADSE